MDVPETSWVCPEETCKKQLSRKQTFVNHIRTLHPNLASVLGHDGDRKRYKSYEWDNTVVIPKSTQYAKKQRLDEWDADMSYEMTYHESDNLNDDEGTLGENTLPSNQPLLQEPEPDPPLYVIPPTDSLYESQLTRSDFNLCVGAFATRFNLSSVGLEHLLNLTKLIMPASNIGESTVSGLKESCGFNKDYLKQHVYCKRCNKVFVDQEMCQTPGCTGKKSAKENVSYFVTSDIGGQLRTVLEKPGTWDSIKRSSSSNDVISDVNSGESYKALLLPGGFLHNSNNVTFSMFTDGVPLFKSSGVSIWPVYLIVNELPAKERFSRKNMILWGVWQGHGKPRMSMFLAPLVKDLTSLFLNGTSILVNGNEHCVKAKLLVCTMDLQARAYVTNMTQHNGHCGCLYCLEPGEVVASGKGHSRSYPYRPFTKRSDRGVEASAQQAVNANKRVDGFLGESVLSCLPDFSLTENIVIDYMHGILLGISKKMLELWVDSKYSKELWYIGDKTKIMDKFLADIKTPYYFHRRPRAVTNNYNHWKASELRNWLLFYALPCLSTVGMHDVYFRHFSCLVEGTYLLLGEGITKDALTRAELLFNTYVEHLGTLYGPNLLSLNAHNLRHITTCVRMWGPLWCYSCFAFESFNGEIKRSIHGTGNVCREVFWTLQAQRKVEHTIRASQGSGSASQRFLENMTSKREGELFEPAYQCRTSKSRDIKDFDHNVRENLLLLTGPIDIKELKTVAKVARNGFFAVGSLLKQSRSFVPDRAPHLQVLEKISDQLRVVPAQNLREPLVTIMFGNTLVGASLPNHHERD